MHIGLIAPPWAPVPPKLYGGIELVLDQLATGLGDAGHHVTLFTTGDSTSPVERRWVFPQAEGLRMGIAVPELRHAIHAYKELAGCDVVHDHTMVGPFLAERYPDLPVCTTIHGPLDGELADVYRALAGRVAVLGISHAQLKPAPDIEVRRIIHHGIRAADFPFGDGKGDDDGEYLLFLGRMAASKGAHRAIEVARRCGVRLLMAAKMREPAERAYFEQQVEPLLAPGVAEYLGEVPHERKIELLCGARALLFPIRWNEPFGMVMLEAMACGTPVLAFPEGAAPEVVTHGTTGFLCDDEDEMVSAVKSVTELDRLACRAAVEGYFSAERMVAEHVELYEELARA